MHPDGPPDTRAGRDSVGLTMPWIGTREKRVMGGAAIRAALRTRHCPAPSDGQFVIPVEFGPADADTHRPARGRGSMAGVALPLSDDKISDLAYYVARVK